MIYKAFQDLQLSQLGFGTMRLPLREDKSIDEELAAAMTDAAIRQGVNYFDTAWPYHSGKSETVIGKILQNYPRESFYLADKFPGHQIAPTYDVADIFERQLKKCGVEYFDFYLLHNVYENSIGVYEAARWNIIPYLLEQKKNGRIRHLGFSTHAGLPALEQFLQRHGEEMEFCQIQLNYLDWTLQQAKEKCELLNRYNIPIWVMEPIRGGKLANLPESMTAELRAMRPEASAASWALRWVQQIPGVTMILSGMSDLAQMEDNLATFDHPQPLSEEETACLLRFAEQMKNAVPCTACRYCCDGCPQRINIPQMLRVLNEIRIAPSTNAIMAVEALPESQQPSACLGCGACAAMHPSRASASACGRRSVWGLDAGSCGGLLLFELLAAGGIDGADTGIDDTVKQVGDQIAERDHYGGNDNAGHDRRNILFTQCRKHHAAHAVDAEDLLDNDGAAEEITD